MEEELRGGNSQASEGYGIMGSKHPFNPGPLWFHFQVCIIVPLFLQLPSTITSHTTILPSNQHIQNTDTSEVL